MHHTKEIQNIRIEYRFGSLRKSQLNLDPLVNFEQWLHDAIHLPEKIPEAMCLSTVDAQGMPHSRMVLLKDYSHEGFVFYTNLKSAKGQQITHNNAVSLLFWWPLAQRQIRINGHAFPIASKDADAYFALRPRESQVAAWASTQSQPIENREALENAFAQSKEQFRNKPVARPAFWSGFIVRVIRYEFWQGGENRLHDRFVYAKDKDNSWKIQRLAP